MVLQGLLPRERGVSFSGTEIDVPEKGVRQCNRKLY